MPWYKIIKELFVCLIMSSILIFFRYIREWAEYKKTDAYKEFRKHQMEQKDTILSKKVKHNPPENSVPAGN